MNLCKVPNNTFYLNMAQRFYKCIREGQLSPQALTSLKVEDGEEKANVSV